ncbi:MAG: GNAT family N-acetyltransferase [Kofleriaceae bacterium]
MQLRWHERAFGELGVDELYAIVALRERVFIVEQTCVYLDADGLDPAARHLWAAAGDAIHAYLRVVPAGAKFAEVSIGRVIVAPERRGTGLGKELMQRGLAIAGEVAVRISAQAHLQKFYRELGFAAVSDVYDEDGIPHLEMLRAAPAER